MAECIVVDETGSHQSPNQLTFSMTFTEPQWYRFWNLLALGCVMSDDLVDVAEGRLTQVDPTEAKHWRRFAKECSHVLADGKVERIKKVTGDNTIV